MIILTAFAIGLLTVGVRSFVCYALAGCLIICAFALAALVPGGSISLAALVMALLAYNIGIASTIVIAVVLEPRLRV